jgi:hypothetical protein
VLRAIAEIDVAINDVDPRLALLVAAARDALNQLMINASRMPHNNYVTATDLVFTNELINEHDIANNRIAVEERLHAVRRHKIAVTAPPPQSLHTKHRDRCNNQRVSEHH